MPDVDVMPEERSHHRVERLAHAVYGLILLTAGIGELATHDEDAAMAAALVVGATIVLVIAHSYSAFIANMVTHRSPPESHYLRSNALDQLTLAIPAVVAVVVLALSDAGAYSVGVAYVIILVTSLASLFMLGLLIGHQRGWPPFATMLLGVANVALGGAVVAVEALAAH